MSCDSSCTDPLHLCVGCRAHVDEDFYCYGCSTRICPKCDELHESWVGYEHEFTAHLNGEPRLENHE